MNQSETCTVSGRNCIATSPPSQGRTSHLRNSSGIPRLHLNHGVVVLCGVAFRPAMVQPGSPVEARLPLHACPSETTMWERLGKGTADAHPRCSLPHSRQAGATGEGCGISRANLRDGDVQREEMTLWQSATRINITPPPPTQHTRYWGLRNNNSAPSSSGWERRPGLPFKGGFLVFLTNAPTRTPLIIFC